MQVDDAEVKLHAGAPNCSDCGTAIMPLALMFDEDYDSASRCQLPGTHSQSPQLNHSTLGCAAFYQFERVLELFEEAEALVFVGTSFSVSAFAP
jgi:NAD-dependent SIR2 family protein deacetylase